MQRCEVASQTRPVAIAAHSALVAQPPGTQKLRESHVKEIGHCAPVVHRTAVLQRIVDASQYPLGHSELLVHVTKPASGTGVGVMPERSCSSPHTGHPVRKMPRRAVIENPESVCPRVRIAMPPTWSLGTNTNPC